MTDTNDTARLRALLEGLECQNVEHFMQEASIEDAGGLGKVMAFDIKQLKRIIRVIKVLVSPNEG